MNALFVKYLLNTANRQPPPASNDAGLADAPLMYDGSNVAPGYGDGSHAPYVVWDLGASYSLSQITAYSSTGGYQCYFSATGALGSWTGGSGSGSGTLVSPGQTARFLCFVPYDGSGAAFGTLYETKVWVGGTAAGNLVGGPSADTTPPTFLSGSISADGRTITANFADPDSTGLLPLTGITGFFIENAGGLFTLGNVTASGLVVTLPVAGPRPIWHTDGPTLDYHPGNLTDNSVRAVPVAAFMNGPLTNNSTVYPDTTAPVVLNASINAAGTALTVNWTETQTPPVVGTRGLSLTASGSPVGLSSVSTTGLVTTAALGRVVDAGEAVTLGYSGHAAEVPAGGTTGDFADSMTPPNYVAAFTGQSVSNGSTVVPDTTPPAFLSASVNAAGNLLTVNLTETGSPPCLGTSGFAFTASGAAVALTSPSMTGTTFTAALARTVYAGEACAVSYAPGSVTDSAPAPNPMAAFPAQPVNNGSTVAAPVVDTTPPVPVSASLNAAGNSLTVLFTDPDSANLLPASGIAGLTATVNGGPALLSAATATGVTLTVPIASPPVFQGDSVSLAYVPGNLTDDSPQRVRVDEFTLLVENRSTGIRTLADVPANACQIALIESNLAAPLTWVEIDVSWSGGLYGYIDATQGLTPPGPGWSGSKRLNWTPLDVPGLCYPSDAPRTPYETGYRTPHPDLAQLAGSGSRTFRLDGLPPGTIGIRLGLGVNCTRGYSLALTGYRTNLDAVTDGAGHPAARTIRIGYTAPAVPPGFGYYLGPAIYAQADSLPLLTEAGWAYWTYLTA